ncbi:MAG: hypothetical protein NT062_28965 [Proteobacteria bacterium]|nr:hypothetical protein [Pseudomonadota bacterium]
MNIRDHVALLDERLDRLSVGRRLVASLGFEPRSVELAIYKPGGNDTAERPALPFQFEIEPWRKDDGARGLAPSTLLRGRAVVGKSATFEFTLALPPAEAAEIYYRDPVMNAQQAASDAPPVWLALGPTSALHPAVRAEVARIFMPPGAAVVSGQSKVTYTCRVIGHRVSRRNDRYVEPGSGRWTLLRLVEPGDGWAALDLSDGRGEFFSAGLDEATTTCGQHLARAIG